VVRTASFSHDDDDGDGDDDGGDGGDEDYGYEITTQHWTVQDQDQSKQHGKMSI